tara:strand:- start:4068 stop:4718 length:651 start_codon:yes stop_codon:yes gene_type:complete
MFRERHRKNDFISPVFVHKLEKHDEIKSQVLALIKNDDGRISQTTDGKGTDIAKTDFYKTNSEVSEYKEYVTPFLVEHIQKIWYENKIFPNCLFSMGNMWYQQYKNNNFHTWHTHEKSHFTNVYFVQLPDNGTKFNPFGTQVLNLKGERIYFDEMEEGFIMTFPGYLLHRSPVNTTNQTKTIISWNMQIIEKSASISEGRFKKENKVIEAGQENKG